MGCAPVSGATLKINETKPGNSTAISRLCLAEHGDSEKSSKRRLDLDAAYRKALNTGTFPVYRVHSCRD